MSGMPNHYLQLLGAQLLDLSGCLKSNKSTLFTVDLERVSDDPDHKNGEDWLTFITSSSTSPQKELSQFITHFPFVKILHYGHRTAVLRVFSRNRTS